MDDEFLVRVMPFSNATQKENTAFFIKICLQNQRYVIRVIKRLHWKFLVVNELWLQAGIRMSKLYWRFYIRQDFSYFQLFFLGIFFRWRFFWGFWLFIFFGTLVLGFLIIACLLYFHNFLQTSQDRINNTPPVC